VAESIEPTVKDQEQNANAEFEKLKREFGRHGQHCMLVNALVNCATVEQPFSKTALALELSEDDLARRRLVGRPCLLSEQILILE